MRANKTPKIKSLFVAGITSVLAGVLCLLISSWYEKRLIESSRQQVQSIITPYGNTLSTIMNEHMNLLDALSAFVIADSQDENFKKHFLTFAGSLYAAKDNIRCIQFFPADGPVFLFPKTKNEATIGRTLNDLINDERFEVRKDVKRAVTSKKITLSGPYDLRQGGLGLVGRLAVFKGESLYGITVLVFDLPPIFKHAKLEPAPAGLTIGLQDNKGRLFLGNSAAFKDSPVIYNIVLPGQMWQLAAIPSNSWAGSIKQHLIIFQVICLFLVVLLAVLAYALCFQSSRLKENVKERTLALQQSEEKFRIMFDEAPLGVALIAPQNGEIIESNSQFTEITGYIAGRKQKIDWQKTIHPDNKEDILSKLELLREKTLLGLNQTYHFIRQDQSATWINLTITPVSISSNESQQLLCMVEDIAKRIDDEKKQEHLRTQLSQAQKMESIGLLAGGVAHDFNNLLTIILMQTAMAMTGLDPDDPLRAKLNDIMIAAEKSANLTRQLLAFARKQVVMPKELNLNQAISKMLKMLKHVVGESIDLSWQPVDDIWLIKMDPAHVDQILTNLCVNAHDAIDGNGEIIIRTEKVSISQNDDSRKIDISPGDYTVLSVSDNGNGMAEETLSHLFDPFFTTKDLGKGTGLGMATVYGNVKQNNGFIIAESSIGRGTRITIYFPRYIPSTIMQSQNVEVKELSMGTETILVVEDDENLLRITEATLAKYGYTILTSNKPAEAVMIFKEHVDEIDLLITDVIMPVMNGENLVTALKTIKPTLKYLFMSGYSANIIDKNENFIQKPFSDNDLVEKVRTLLDQS